MRLRAVFVLIIGGLVTWGVLHAQKPFKDYPVQEEHAAADLPSDWDREGAVFSDVISRDPDRVAYALMQGQAGTSDSEREPK